jgi:predicted Holliday junction resolvase-like endonuclease
MPPDFLLFALIFLLGIIVAYLIFRIRVSVFKERAYNDLERWKLEHTQEIRKDSVSRSRSTLKGRISEQMAPLLPEFPFSLADARFIGNPIDFVVFDGYTQAKDENATRIDVILVEIKKGKKSRLSREEILIKRAVEEGRISWRTIILDDTDPADTTANDVQTKPDG